MSYRNKIGLCIFFMLSEIILISLGTWQLRRLIWKESLIEDSVSKHLLPPIELGNQKIDNVINYQLHSAKCQGKFLYDKEIHLYPGSRMKMDKQGYILLTPFLLKTGEYILVNRGFSSLDQISNSTKTEEEANIEGYLLSSEKAARFTPKNDISNNIWFNLDLEEIQNVLDIPLLPVYLVLQKADIQLNTTLPTFKLENIRNDHLAYAITWYSIAVGVLILFIYKMKRQ